MKKILVVFSLILVFLTGCDIPADYHEGSGKEWIEEQVRNGTMTREEANILLKQEK